MFSPVNPDDTKWFGTYFFHARLQGLQSFLCMVPFPVKDYLKLSMRQSGENEAPHPDLLVGRRIYFNEENRMNASLKSLARAREELVYRSLR